MAMKLPHSETIKAVTEDLRPPEEIACTTCPNSMWFASKGEIQCYCRIMFVISYNSANRVKRPDILVCDGESMAFATGEEMP